MGKDTLLQQLDDGFQSLIASVDGLSDEQMLMVWLDGWGVRDILAHTAGWHREMSKAFERIARGERPVPEDVDYSNFDSWNASFATMAKDIPPQEVLRELRESQKAYRDAAAAVPEDRFEEGRAAHRIVHLTGIDHYAEHAANIREWRQAEGI
jgi:hypothetical protein